MPEFFSSGRAIDIVLIVIAIEAICLIVLSRQSAKRFAIAEIVLALLPGAFLLLALRAALLQSSWIWIALFLILAFPAHLADLSRRWKTSKTDRVVAEQDASARTSRDVRTRQENLSL